jgi:transposase
MRAYSLDLRERALAALDAGSSRDEVLRLFKISHSTLKRWLRRRRAGLPLAAERPSGRTHALTDTHLAELRTRLEAAADAAIAAHTQWWNDTHPDHYVSPKTIERAITRLGWTRKKRLSVPANAMKLHAKPSVSRLGNAARTTS